MYATIIDRKLSLHDGIPTLEQMQEIVGGYITTALRAPFKSHKNFTMDVLCNDEGLCIGLPIDHVRMTDGSPIAGNMVIVGASERTGNYVTSMTKADLDGVLAFIGRLPITLTPADFGF
jgi:hypothetical protein